MRKEKKILMKMKFECKATELKCEYMHKANRECGVAATLLCAFRVPSMCKAMRTCFQYAREVEQWQRCIGAALCACNPLHGWEAVWGVGAILCIAREQLGGGVRGPLLCWAALGNVYAILLHGWKAL